MKDSNYIPDGTGVVMGDTKPMPDRGTSTGFTEFAAELDGKDISPDATNTLGKITGTNSDAPGDCHSDDPTFGANAADKAEDAREGGY